ncbi:MAG: amidohydrolase family protein [Alphaproteobacteria bacterium]
MRAAARLLLAALGALLAAYSAQAQQTTGVTAFVGATLIDGTGAEPLADATIVIKGERIVAAGELDALEIPEGAEVIELAGKWIIPGLIDAHVHFFQSGGLYTRPDVVDLRDRRAYADEIALIRRRLPATLARYLASGVTSVIDAGGPFSNFEVRDLANKTRLAPRVAVAGPLLATWAPDALQSDDPPIIRVRSRGEARAQVRRQLAHKPDLVKLWLVRIFDLATEFKWVRAAIEESHAAGVRVFAHATRRELARAAMRAGVDVLAHSVTDRTLDHPFIAMLKNRDVVYVTTLVVGERYHNVLSGAADLSDVERRLGDPEAIASFADASAVPAGALPAWVRPGSAPPDDGIAFANLRSLAAAGVTIAAGSDAGNIGTLHGPALHRELAAMAGAGLSPMQVIVAATRGGAKAMGRAAELGTIEAGKHADLVVLDADPLADIRNTQAIHRVVKGGEILDPKEIMAEAGPD